jgi:TPR repeat protein
MSTSQSYEALTSTPQSYEALTSTGTETTATIGATNEVTVPTEAQTEYISAIKEVLKKNNCIYVTIDPPESIERIFKLLCLGVPSEPRNGVEFMYFGWYNEYIKKNIKQSTQYYKKAVNLDNTAAMCNLARRYKKKGKCSKMKALLEKAIALGNVIAMNDIAHYYEEQNEKDTALQYYEKAEALGDVHAMFNLGNYYQDSGDYDKMKQYYNKAIKLEYPPAMNNLGWHYENVENNNELARHWYMKAVKLGYSPSMVCLGSFFEEQLEDFEKARYWYLKAAELGNVNAFFYLGCYFEQIKDYEEAKKWYTKAADLDHTNAILNLGDLLCDIEKNVVAAKGQYIKALKLGDKRSISRIVFYYLDVSNDFSFFELTDLIPSEDIIKIVNNSIPQYYVFPRKYYGHFLSLNTSKCCCIVKIKRYIFWKTGIFPRKYDEKYFPIFVELCSVKEFPQDLLLSIAGHLFD